MGTANSIAPVGKRSRRNRVRGFSLVELAMVLFIISLVVGGLLVPLSTQLEARQRSATEASLEEIREALIGFAIIEGRLPCYTTETDPQAVDYGEEDATCYVTALTTDGILPWKTLGLNTGTDPWGAPRTAATDSWNGYWRYRVDPNFKTQFSLATEPTANNLFVQMLNAGASQSGSAAFTNLTSTTEPPVALVYSTGANLAEDGLNAAYEATSATYEGGNVSNLDRDGDGDEDEFDDVITWITRPLLYSRMVNAGSLP